MFIGIAEAGLASAVLRTLVANCRGQRIDPKRYFEEALWRRGAGAARAGEAGGVETVFVNSFRARRQESHHLFD